MSNGLSSIFSSMGLPQTDHERDDNPQVLTVSQIILETLASDGISSSSHSQNARYDSERFGTQSINGGTVRDLGTGLQNLKVWSPALGYQFSGVASNWTRNPLENSWPFISYALLKLSIESVSFSGSARHVGTVPRFCGFVGASFRTRACRVQ